MHSCTIMPNQEVLRCIGIQYPIVIANNPLKPHALHLPSEVWRSLEFTDCKGNLNLQIEKNRPGDKMLLLRIIPAKDLRPTTT